MAISSQKIFDLQNELLSTAELIRLDVIEKLDPINKKQYSQYFTPVSISKFMASMFTINEDEISILDPGAGTGILSVALIDHILKSKNKPKKLVLTAIEIDEKLFSILENNLELCIRVCEESNIEISTHIIKDDFIKIGVESVISESQFFPTGNFTERYDMIIMNPPYKKINSNSYTRKLLSSINIETSNIYSGFLSVAIKILKSRGQLVAITPRSFTNGPYFRSFRNLFYREMAFSQIHVFNSRKQAFKENDVLQENIIYHARKNSDKSKIKISSSDGPHDYVHTNFTVPYNNVIHNTDPNKIIHIVTDINSKRIIDRIFKLPFSLNELGLEVSTGRVVDFRKRNNLQFESNSHTVPLIYSFHFNNGIINWPKQNLKKPDSIIDNEETDELFLSKGFYVLCRRFSAKEEKRRIVAALFNPNLIISDKVGFENHVNVFHKKNNSLSENQARGLTIFLNSTIIDLYFRVFNGHTQVNAADLRMLRYPSNEQLEKLGGYFNNSLPSQEKIDSIIDKELFNMETSSDPTNVNKRISETLIILAKIGIPKAQQNERSALTLLALLDLKVNDLWKNAKAPLIGITEMMTFFKDHYGKEYAPNSRETVRRFTVHQFVQAGLVLPNPDKPRPINSPHYVYQIEPGALKLIRLYKSKIWKNKLESYLASIKTLKQKYAQERDLQKIPIKINEGSEILMSPGGQNVLVKEIVDEFCP